MFPSNKQARERTGYGVFVIWCLFYCNVEEGYISIHDSFLHFGGFASELEVCCVLTSSFFWLSLPMVGLASFLSQRFRLNIRGQILCLGNIFSWSQ